MFQCKTIWGHFNRDFKRWEFEKPWSAPGFEPSTLDLLTPHHQASGEHLPCDFSHLSDRLNFPYTSGHCPLEDRLEAASNQQFWSRSAFIQSVYAQQEYQPTAWLISSRYRARTSLKKDYPGGEGGGGTWDFEVFIYFLSHLQMELSLFLAKLFHSS